MGLHFNGEARDTCWGRGMFRGYVSGCMLRRMFRGYVSGVCFGVCYGVCFAGVQPVCHFKPEPPKKNTCFRHYAKYALVTARLGREHVFVSAKEIPAWGRKWVLTCSDQSWRSWLRSGASKTLSTACGHMMMMLAWQNPKSLPWSTSGRTRVRMLSRFVVLCIVVLLFWCGYCCGAVRAGGVFANPQRPKYHFMQEHKT